MGWGDGGMHGGYKWGPVPIMLLITFTAVLGWPLTPRCLAFSSQLSPAANVCGPILQSFLLGFPLGSQGPRNCPSLTVRTSAAFLSVHISKADSVAFWRNPSPTCQAQLRLLPSPPLQHGSHFLGWPQEASDR